MKITQITAKNLEEHLESILTLCDEFLALIGEPRDRSPDEKHRIIHQMVAADQTVILLQSDENDSPVGICYYNLGTGYACGGEYLWINCVYVRKAFQGKGYGTAFLNRVQTDAHERNATLIMSTRDQENLASDRLFSKNNFEQEHQVIITKNRE